MDWFLSLYIGTTIFGAGVTIIDLLGILGEDHSEDGTGDHGDHDGDYGGDHDDGFDHDSDSDGDHDGDFDHDSDSDGDHDGDFDHGGDDHLASEEGHEEDADSASIVAHDQKTGRRRGNPVLRILSVARSLVYFCLGFGPVGWFALSTGIGNLLSLAWSIPVGIGAVIGTRALKRFMRKDLDSQVNESELIMESAEVIVSIQKGQMGKIRTFVGEAPVERYARSQNPGKSFPKGSKVFITDLTDECVLVDDQR